MDEPYLPVEKAPTREEIDGTPGALLLEFGTPWCGFCRALAPQVAELLRGHARVRHIKVEDGPGQALGRSFNVRLWPNLVFLRDGVIVRQLARPGASDLRSAFQALADSGR
jgi:thioredoxin 1